jgi:uncharacterized membrane protein
MGELRLQLQPVASWPVVLIVAVLLVGLVWVRPRFARLSAGRRAVLVALRLVVVLMTLVALVRPMLVYTKVEPLRASLVVLVDGSRSMQIEDSLGDASRWAAVRTLLESASDDLKKLAETWDVKAYQFDAESHKLNLRDGRPELPAAPVGEQSALGAALDEALEREANGRVLGVLLLSDGAQRAAAPRDMPPQVAARRLAAENIPLYTITFGKSSGSERADLAIGDLVTNETIFSEAPTEVRGLVTANGYANQPVRVQLLWESADGMSAVDTLQVDSGAEGAAVPIVLRHTPRSPGEYKVSLRVEPREGELVTTNNEASTFVTVRAGGINVLYLIGAKQVGGRAGGREQTFVRASLARSPDIVVEHRLINYKPMRADLRETIRDGRFDVFMLDDVDAQGLSSESWQAMADRVREGAGLMMIGGYHSFGPGGFRENPLSDVLPIDFGRAQRQPFGETPRSDVHLPAPVKIQPAAPLGARHPIMQIAGAGARSDAAATWAALPPLDGANRVARDELKRNATVLAETGDGQRHPLLVAGQWGNGRTLAFAGDSTWKWQMLGFGDAHRRFWRQSVLWLAKQDEQTEGRVWIRLPGRRVMRGARVDFSVGAENAEHQPVEAAQFEIKIETPDGKTLDVAPTKSGDQWGATFRETSAAGDYRIRLTARDGGIVLGTAEARFLVPKQDMELDRPAAEPTLMAQLAEMTKPAGGEALAAEQLPALLKRLAEKSPELKEEVLAKTTYWDTWPFFLIFVGLLGVEWYLRKQWGLV